MHSKLNKEYKNALFIGNIDDFNKTILHQRDSFEFSCVKCGKKYNIKRPRKERFNRYKTLLCYKCYIESHPEYIKARSEGIINSWNKITDKQKIERINKIKQTKLKRYGNPNYTNKNKMSISLKNKSLEEKREIRSKIKKTNLERYGDENYNNRKQAKSTMMKKYGIRYYNNPESRYTTNMKKYRCKFPMQNNDIKQKTKLHNLKNIGTTTNLITKNQIENTKRIKLSKYHTAATSIKYNYFGIKFCSKPELAVWIYCIDHNIPIIREPICLNYLDKNNKLLNYYPDFWIQDMGLVEIKGPRYWYNDKMIFPYVKKKYNGENFTEEELNYLNDLYERKHQCGLYNGVKFLKKSNYDEYIKYVENKYGVNYLNNFNIKNAINPSYLTLNYYESISKPYAAIPIYYSRLVNRNKGISPYDIDNNSEYSFSNNIGISPYEKM